MVQLSPRQSEAFELLSAGLTYKEIAHKFGVDYRTVKEHVYKAVAKYGAISVIQAVVMYTKDKIRQEVL